MERTDFIYRTPMGRVAIESDGAAITHFAFGPVQLAGRQHATALTNRASSEVLEYLAGKRIAFEVPVRAEGSRCPAGGGASLWSKSHPAVRSLP